MNRKILLLFLVLTATLILACNFNMVFATTTYVDYEHAGALIYIQVPGSGTWIRLNVFGQMQGNYYDGHHNADRFMIYVLKTGGDPSKTSDWVAVSGYEDNPTRSAFSDSLGLGTVENVVAPGNIQVLKDLDANTITVHWNIPLVIPATSSTPAATIPPGKIVLSEYGTLQYSTSPGFPSFVAIGPMGWGVKYEYHYYLATGSFFCQDWNIKWQPAGIGPLASQIPRAVMDRVWTWTYPFS